MGASPGLVYGQVPTAAQWDGFFTVKQDDIASLSSAQLLTLAQLLVPLWLNSLPVYSGSGAAPVATGQWFVNNGKLEQAQ